MSELDQFLEMENEGVKSNDLNLSNVYSVRQGGFGIENGLKTYLSTLTIEELQQDITFYEKLSDDKGWPVSHIIQREVDDERVNSIVKKYILSIGRDIKYFPPIIIALLPRDTDGNFASGYNYVPDVSAETREAILEKSKYRSNETFKGVLDQRTNQSIVDGLYYFNTLTIFDHNILCWDVSKFYAVVIDGQHRLDALIRAKEHNVTYSKAVQDVVFIDVSTLAEKKRDLSPIELFRTIFIDINTNAKSVGLVRRILMDDKDLASLCVQSLVESITKDGKSKDENSYIRSILIDWDGGAFKHELPFITGVLTLYQTINDELVSDRLSTINDHRDQKKIQYFISLLNDIFFVDTTIKMDADKIDISTLEKSFINYLKEKEITRDVFAEEVQQEVMDSILFNYDYRVLEVAQENFEKFFLKPIVSVFSNFKPYVKVIEILNELDAFNNQSTLYKSLLLSRIKAFANANTRDAYLNARQQIAEKLNQNYYLLFTVVGQKAIFKSLFEQIWTNFKHGVTPETVAKTVNDYVQKLNVALDLFDENSFLLFGKEETEISSDSSVFEEYGTIYSSFWEGILFEDKRIIYNSQGVRAFSDVINFILNSIEESPSIQQKNLKDSNIRFAEQRIKRLLKKRFVRTEEEYNTLAQTILYNKKQFLIDRINGLVKTVEDGSAG